MRIRKVSQTTPVQAHLTNSYSESTQDGYSCNHINELVDEKYTKTYTDKGITFTFTKIGHVVNLVISGTTAEQIVAATNYEFVIDEEFVPTNGLSTNLVIGEGNPGQTMIVYIQTNNKLMYRTRINLNVPFYPRAMITYLV